MTLKDCTKEELISIIDRFKDYAFDNGEYYLCRCLREIEHERELKRLDEADRWSEIAYQKRLAYCDLIRKYEGQKLTDIPSEVSQKAVALLKEAEAADKKYAHLVSRKADGGSPL